MALSERAPVLSLDAIIQNPGEQPSGPRQRASELPAGVPRSINHGLAWFGAQFRSFHDYVLMLGPADIVELESGLRDFKDLCLDGTQVSRDNFPLPHLGPKLDALRREIHDGRGFGCIRGLAPEKYPVEDLTILQLAIQARIANLCGRQDKKGNMMVHIVADNTSQIRADHHRHSTAAITFHNEESGDVVSWLTRSCAEVGGRCVIASAYTVYNVLAASRPDLIRVLMRSDWPFAFPKFHCRPILYYHRNRLIMNFGRTPLLGSASHPRSSDLPALTPVQREALDAIEAIGRATQLEMRTEPGDIHFINNLAILHRREGFVNGAQASQKRHLVRMRLRDKDLGWSIPSELHDEWDRAFVKGKPTMWHLQPMPEGFFPLRTQAN